MKNGEEPINPVLLRQIGTHEYKVASEKDSREGIYLTSKLGLTKREYFAAMAMQAIGSNALMIDTANWEWLAKNAVMAADALLAELEKPTDK